MNIIMLACLVGWFSMGLLVCASLMVFSKKMEHDADFEAAAEDELADDRARIEADEKAAAAFERRFKLHPNELWG